MKDEEFGEIPQETRRWFVEPGQEKVLPHLPIPPRSFALAIGPVVWGLMGDVLNLRFLRLLQPHIWSLVKAGIAAEKGSSCKQGLMLALLPMLDPKGMCP